MAKCNWIFTCNPKSTVETVFVWLNLGSDKKQICMASFVDPGLIHLRVGKPQGSGGETRTVDRIDQVMTEVIAFPLKI